MPPSVTRETLWIDTPQGQLFASHWFPTHSPEHNSEHTPQAPIVLFHDSLGCIALWRNFPEQLSQASGREVIAYDRLGFGQSDPCPERLAPNFIRHEAEHFFVHVKHALGIDGFVALGHSVGAGMAAACAATQTDSCRALITIAAQAFVEDRTLQGIRAAQQQFEQPQHMARLEKYHGDKASWVLDAWTSTWLAESFGDWTIEREVGPIHCPQLVLHGEHDEFGSALHPMRVAKLSTVASECLILDGCRHVPHREQPEVVLAAITRFLQASH